LQDRPHHPKLIRGEVVAGKEPGGKYTTAGYTVGRAKTEDAKPSASVHIPPRHARARQ
jgi:hypothetical protein